VNAILLYRVGNWLHRHRIPVLPGLVRNLVFLLYNSYIPPSATIGRGTLFAYGAIGVVIHADAKIGAGCVTIGAAEACVAPTRHACPTVGDHCYLGAGAKLLGGIHIGEQCQIGAGAVVLKDVPPRSVVVGMPGRVVGHSPDDYRAIRSGPDA
jgi:serine O-acetyltransferase